MIKSEKQINNTAKSYYRMVYSYKGKPYGKYYFAIEDVIREYNMLDSSEIIYDYVYVERCTHIYEFIKMKN